MNNSVCFFFFFFNQQGWGGCLVLPKRETKLLSCKALGTCDY